LAEVICGSAEAVRESSGRWSTVWTVRDINRKKLTVKNIALGEPMINARLFRKSFFKNLGGFSLNYSLASDRDFLLRAAEAGGAQQEVDAITYRYRWHSGSSTMTEGNALTDKLSHENLAIAKTHLSKAIGGSRKTLLRWHDRLTVQAAMNSLEDCRWSGLIQVFREGSSKNRVWGFYFAAEILRSLPGFLFRGGRTRKQILLRGQ
jgi:hypothetical protein